MSEPVLRFAGAEICRVEEMKHTSTLAMMGAGADFIAKHKTWLEPLFHNGDGTWNFMFQSWVMRIDGKIFVIDPCNGNGRPHAYPMFRDLDTPYLERFRATGVDPEDVDVVFCTHLHHDHCGWCTKKVEGRYVPTFPNATYLYVNREFERWDARRPGYRSVDYNDGIFEISVLPIIEAGLAKFIDSGAQITPSVSIEAAPGHTLGHSILRVASQGEMILFTGDCFHHPAQIVDPTLHYPGCDDLDMAIATRRRLIAECAESGALIIPAHFSAPYAGWIRKHEDGYRFEPLT